MVNDIHQSTTKVEHTTVANEDIAEFRDVTSQIPNLTDYIDELDYDEGSAEMTDEDYF